LLRRRLPPAGPHPAGDGQARPGDLSGALWARSEREVQPQSLVDVGLESGADTSDPRSDAAHARGSHLLRLRLGVAVQARRRWRGFSVPRPHDPTTRPSRCDELAVETWTRAPTRLHGAVDGTAGRMYKEPTRKAHEGQPVDLSPTARACAATLLIAAGFLRGGSVVLDPPRVAVASALSR